MSGGAGEQKTTEWSDKARGLAAALREMVYASGGAFLGIYGGKQAIFFAELCQKSGRWVLGRSAQELWQRPDDLAERADLLAERTALRLAREGWEGLPLALCISEDECICKLFPLSAEIPAEEQKTAAFWELDHYLQSCGLTGDMASSTTVRLPGEEAVVEAVILLKEKIRMLEEAFDARGCSLTGLYPETPLLAECRQGKGGWQIGEMAVQGEEIEEKSMEGYRRALYAAAALGGMAGCDWPGSLLERETEKSRWNYEGIGKIAMILAVVLAAAILAADLGEFYLVSQRVGEAERQMAELETERQVMEADRKMAALAEHKEACLTRLSADSRPLDSVLIHLGTVTVEGVWLTEVDCTGEKAMVMRGEAVDYSALGDFLEAFEKDRGFFPSVPLLEDSRQKAEGGGIEFCLKLDVEM